jgi:hypothetical protein
MKQVIQVEPPRVDTDQAPVSSKHQKLVVSALVTSVMKEPVVSLSSKNLKRLTYINRL